MSNINNLQNLLQEGLVQTGHVHKCCIIKLAGFLLAASSHAFKPDRPERMALVKAFRNLNSIREKGIEFDGKRYTPIRADKNAIYGKHEDGGIVMRRNSTYLVVAIYKKSMYPSVCVEAVEQLSQYIQEMNMPSAFTRLVEQRLLEME